jgi:hypothetical protein
MPNKISWEILNILTTKNEYINSVDGLISLVQSFLNAYISKNNNVYVFFFFLAVLVFELRTSCLQGGALLLQTHFQRQLYFNKAKGGDKDRAQTDF